MEHKSNFFKRKVKYFEENKFGAMTLMITFQSCYGSVAAMYSLKIENYLVLAVAVIVTMMSNAVFLAQAPAKWCVGMFSLSVIANTLLLLTYLILTL